MSPLVFSLSVSQPWVRLLMDRRKKKEQTQKQRVEVGKGHDVCCTY